jgi:polyhydroxyalkanoate synthesis regulator phasin
MAEQWLSIVEYARATGISDMTIRRRIRTGRIRADLRDGKYYIPVEHQQVSSITHRSNGVAKNNDLPAPHLNGVPALVKSRSESNHTHERSIPSVSRMEDARPIAHHQVSKGRVGPQYSSDHGLDDHSSYTTHTSQANALEQSPSVWTSLPDNVTRPLVDAGMASVEARALIEFCDRALDQANSTVTSIEAKYSARLESMNSQLRVKDHEISSLNQQIEDLQLLVQILERKKIG